MQKTLLSCVLLQILVQDYIKILSKPLPIPIVPQEALSTIYCSNYEIAVHSIVLIIIGDESDNIISMLLQPVLKNTGIEFTNCTSFYFTSVSVHWINSTQRFDLDAVIPKNVDQITTGTLVVFAFINTTESASMVIESIIRAESRQESESTYLLICSYPKTLENDKQGIQTIFASVHGEHGKLSLSSKLYFMIPRKFSDNNGWKNSTSSISNAYHYFEAYCLSTNNMKINEVIVENLGNIVTTRMDLKGDTITATAPMGNLTQGEIIWGESDDGTPYLKTGFGVEIFKCIQDALHFRSISLPTTGWASIFPNGSWQEGMAQEVLSDRADIGLAKTSILPYRAEALRYLQPIHTLIVTAYFKQPEEGSLRNIFILPFEFHLWICIIVTWFLFFISVLCLHWLKKTDIYFEDNDIDQLDAFVWIIASISQRGLHATPRSYSFRIVFMTGEILALVLFVAYAATLVSIFSTPIAPIKSVEDLLRSRFRLFVDANNAGARLVVSKSSLTATTNTNNLLSSRIESSGNYSYITASKGAALLSTAEQVAFITFPDTFYTTYGNIYGNSEKYLCDEISSLAVTRIPFRSGLFLAKNSVYNQLFSVKMANIFTSGLMNRYVKEYERTYLPACSDDLKERKNPTLAISHVWPAFLLFGLGALVSAIVFLYEYFMNIWNRWY